MPCDLTIEEVFKLAQRAGLKPKRWSGSRLKNYNGFKHEQRVLKWQALNLAIDMGLEASPLLESCSICSSGSNVNYHSEDYSSMSGHYLLCKSCHIRIHNRFKSPARWAEHAAAYGNGNSWFQNLIGSKSPMPSPKSISFKKIDRELRPLKSEERSHGRAELSLLMETIRHDFLKALGTKWKCNPDPVDGYKVEFDIQKRESFLLEAIRLRNEYARLVQRHGVNHGILVKMDSNLANRDRIVRWK